MLETNGIMAPILKISIKLEMIVKNIAKMIAIFFFLSKNLNSFINSKNEYTYSFFIIEIMNFN